MMIKKKIGAGILAINNEDGKILFCRRGLDSSFSKCWAFFGGTFEDKDITPRQTAKREFFEETRSEEEYKISKKPFFITSNPFIDFYTYICFFERQPKISINEENLDYGWFDIDKIPKNLHPGVKDLFDKKYNSLKLIIRDLKENK